MILSLSHKLGSLFSIGCHGFIYSAKFSDIVNKNNMHFLVRFKVLMMASMKITVFWSQKMTNVSRSLP
jgi:hypothetical protein